MGMFGALKRKPMFGEIPGMGPYNTPGIGDGMTPPVGAMDPNTQAMTKKPGFFAPGQTGRHIVGFIGDALQQMSGGQPTYMPQMMQMKQQDAEIRARLQAALEKRKADREDYTWKAEYDRANPKPINNDTINDFNWYKSLSDEDKAIYSQMKPEYRQGPDGKFYRVETAQGPLPTFTDDDWNKGQPVGGSVGNGAEGFPNWY